MPGQAIHELVRKLGISRDRLASMIDATILSPTATLEDYRRLISDVASGGFHCAMMPPQAALLLAREASSSGVMLCSVVGFPYGYEPVEHKVGLLEALAEGGVGEVDAVANLSLVLSGEWGRVEEEVSSLADAARSAGVKLKLIVEAPVLSDEQLARLASIARGARVDYLKTSTGVISKGGDPYTVARLYRVAGGVPVKAAGGIRTGYDALMAIAAGAARIGASSYRRIVETLPVG